MALEESSFWFRGRQRLIAMLLTQRFPSATALLEVGCGNGFVLAGLSRTHPWVGLTGLEMYFDGLIATRRRVPEAALVQGDIMALPLQRRFDVVCAFDVLEHLDEDLEALRRMVALVNPGGGVLLSVPQHPKLWSPADDYARHRRRYSRKQFEELLRCAGLDQVGSTSFLSGLLPLMWLVRMYYKARPSNYRFEASLRQPRMASRLLESYLAFELWLLRRGARPRFGGSLFAWGTVPSEVELTAL